MRSFAIPDVGCMELQWNPYFGEVGLLYAIKCLGQSVHLTFMDGYPTQDKVFLVLPSVGVP